MKRKTIFLIIVLVSLSVCVSYQSAYAIDTFDSGLNGWASSISNPSTVTNDNGVMKNVGIFTGRYSSSLVEKTFTLLSSFENITISFDLRSVVGGSFAYRNNAIIQITDSSDNILHQLSYLPYAGLHGTTNTGWHNVSFTLPSSTFTGLTEIKVKLGSTFNYIDDSGDDTVYVDNIDITYIDSVPNAPTGLSISSNTGFASLVWSTPANNGHIITDYKIEYSNDGNNWITFNDGTSNANNAIVNGLTVNQQYSFRVSAINFFGIGNTSNVVTATILFLSITPIVVIPPPDIIVTERSITQNYIGYATVSDVTYLQSLTNNFTSIHFGVNTVLWSATDMLGGMTNATQTITLTPKQFINILDFQTVKQISGKNNIIVNSTGINVSGDGEVIFLLKNYTNQNILFKYADKDQVKITQTATNLLQTSPLPSISNPTSNELTINNIQNNIYLIVKTDNTPVQISAEILQQNPTVPKNIRVVQKSDHIELLWGCPTFDGVSYAGKCTNISFNIKRDGISLANQTSTTYNDYTINTNIPYTYAVQSINIQSNLYSILHQIKTTTLSDITPPILSLKHNKNSILISWQNSYPDVIQYELFRIHDSKIWNLSGGTTSITDNSNIEINGNYSYKIKARSSSTWSAYSPTQTISYTAQRTLTVSLDTLFENLLVKSSIHAIDEGVINKITISDHNGLELAVENITKSLSNNEKYTKTITITPNSNNSPTFITVKILFSDDTTMQKDVQIDTSKFTIKYTPDTSGTGTTAIKNSFTNDSFSLHLKKPQTSNISCKYLTLSNTTESWQNQTSISTYTLNLNTTTSKVYVNCYSDDTLIFSKTFSNNSTKY